VSGDGDAKLGRLRLVPYPREPDVAPAGGGGGGAPPRGGGGGGGAIAGWRIIDDAVVMLDGVAAQVEVAGWRAGPHSTDAESVAALVPDWMCVRAEADRDAQLARYAGRGIGHVWLLDPSERTIEVYRFEAARAGFVRVTIARGAARLRAEPFGDLSLDLSAIWDDTN
jgi:hypothetical protein